jgi:hypothetical protein
MVEKSLEEPDEDEEERRGRSGSLLGLGVTMRMPPYDAFEIGRDVTMGGTTTTGGSWGGVSSLMGTSVSSLRYIVLGKGCFPARFIFRSRIFRRNA